MATALSVIDWIVIAGYLIFLIGFAVWLSRSQGSREDYYVGGRNIGPWPVAISIMATQCSTNSILGAPAFVAFSAGGGLLWLQYELALPLAMVVLILFVMPLFRHLRLVSVYGYLEQRYDLTTRLVLSGLFLFVRAFATAVTVYSIALVIDLITGVGFFWSVILLGVFTVIYDVFGGIRGVIYSDVLQMAILVAVLALLLAILVADSGGMLEMIGSVSNERRQTLDFTHHGLGDGQTFAFWPMLFGGFFLYLAYYGCDQSQVQRTLSTRDIDGSNQALFINGLLRFPLVLLYCLVGVGIAVFAAKHPDFLSGLPEVDGTPEYNLAVPLFMLNELPVGLVGLAIVALFAAAMSSLDSVINSLSATTMEDFVRRYHAARFGAESWSPRTELVYSRWLTVFWGAVTLAMSFFVGDIAPTVLEAINKIGSLANGPVLAVFVLGFLTRRVSGRAALLGLLSGILFNAYCWLEQPGISWLWWNLFGFVVACGVALLFATFSTRHSGAETEIGERRIQRYLADESKINWKRRSLGLILYSGFVLTLMFSLSDL